jgi:hypothetical protein
MANFNVSISIRATDDIYKGVDYYNKQVDGLGKRFANEIKNTVKTLKKNPFFQIKYDNVRCLPLANFPYMIHYTINESLKLVEIFAIIHTSVDTEKWQK